LDFDRPKLSPADDSFTPKINPSAPQPGELPQSKTSTSAADVSLKLWCAGFGHDLAVN
jgi:hypothetical protein